MRETTWGVRRWLWAVTDWSAIVGLACLAVGGALAYHAAVRGGEPAVPDAAYHGDVDRVARLLSHGEPVDGRDADGRTALTEAARAGAVDMVKLLLSRGADANGPDASGATPLVTALLNRHADVAELLLSAGASVRARTARGMDPLMAATIGGDARCVRMTLAAGGDPNAAGRRCNLLSCLCDDRADLASILLGAGLNPDVPDLDGSLPAETLRADGATACLAAIERWRRENRRVVSIGAGPLGG